MSAASEVAYLSRALKAPGIRETAASLAERAREEGWDYEAYLAAVLQEEVTARDSHGGESRVRFARFPQVKTLDDFDFSFLRSVKRDEISHLAQLDFLREKKNIIFLGPPGTGKTHLSIAHAVRAARRGYRAHFATAQEWVTRLAKAKRQGRPDEELERLGRIPLLIVDEVGYIPFDPEAASLFFALVSSLCIRSSLGKRSVGPYWIRRAKGWHRLGWWRPAPRKGRQRESASAVGRSPTPKASARWCTHPPLTGCRARPCEG